MTTLTDNYRITRSHPASPITRAEAHRIARGQAVGVFCFLAGVLILIGCAGKLHERYAVEHQATGSGLAQAQAQNQIAAQQTEEARKAAKGWVKRLIGNVGDILGIQADTLAKAAESHGEEAKAHAVIVADLSDKLDDKTRDFDELYNSTGAKVERFVRKVIWWITGYFFLALILRIVALLATGPLGAGASILSTAMMGPTHWIWSLLDNVWWRRAKPNVA